MKSQKICAIAALALLSSLAATAIADPIEPTNSALQAVGAGDIGQQIINFITSGSYSTAANVSVKSLMSVVSLTLNAIALTMMAWLAVVGGATYIAQTANKGVPGGQVISSFWAPIRISVATILLIPLSSGFSTLQYGVITVAEKGNAAGSALTAKGLEYIYENGAYRPPIVTDSSAVIMGWVGSEVCRQYVNSYQKREAVIFETRRHSSMTTETYMSSYDYKELPGSRQAAYPRRGYCGSLSVEMPKSVLNSRAHTQIVPEKVFGKYSALVDQLQPEVSAIASMILADEKALRALQRNGAAAQSAYESANDAVGQQVSLAAARYVELVDKYNRMLGTVVATSVNDVYSDNAGGISWKDEIISSGWTALGTSYWQISQSQKKINALIKLLSASYQEPQLDRSFETDERFVEMSLRLQGLKRQADEVIKSAPDPKTHIVSIETAGADGNADFLKKMLASIGSGIMTSLVFSDSDGDFITSMQHTGSVISATVDAAVHATIWGNATASALRETTSFTASNLANSAAQLPLVGAFFGGGATAAGGVAVASTTFASELISGYAELIKPLLYALMFVGFLLAVVLPAIPLFFWLMGVVSWMLFFIECLLVSPMWMAAHGTAENDGWGSEHTRQGYMLMIGLFLNPVLRSAGFFAIFLVLQPLSVIAQWIASYLTGVIITGWVSPLIILGAPFVVAIFAYTAAVRVFALPNELFERGLRWINGGQEVTGDSQAEQHNRTTIGVFTNKMEQSNSGRMPDLKASPTPTPTGGSFR
jgi:conjugal transfer/type IV secretion protein DotA/TraY